MEFGIHIYRRDQTAEELMRRLRGLILRTWWLPFKRRIIKRLEREVISDN